MNTVAPYDGPLPEGWSGGTAISKFWRGNYVHLYRVMRTCASCPAEISIDVTKKALQGFSKNAGLALRNCPTCRASHKKRGPGSRGGRSRPVVDNPVPAGVFETTYLTVNGAQVTADDIELMYVELNGAHKRVAELTAKLAQYELQPAMEKSVKNLTKAPDWV